MFWKWLGISYYSVCFLDIQVDGNNDKTGLHLVAQSRYCNERVAEKLLEMECSIEKKDGYGKKPIHITIETNCLTMLRFLYRKKESEHNRVRHNL